ncbi:MAG: SIMPL domain-containing protein [Abitibacteriaceae bacterium]|nr:SIMPL domain-containing protein [Abditibacteriaceae bacterium]
MAEPTDRAKPATIQVSVEHSEEIFADRADLFASIRGSSLVTGNAALTKAREVTQLVSDLKQCGIEDKDILLEGVYAEVSSGTLTKSSHATYQLKIHCSQLDNLANVLGAITSQKNTTLRYIQWDYPDTDKLREQWLVSCIEQANRKASLISQALGVQLMGVYSFRDSYADPESPRGPEYMMPTAGMQATRSKSRSSIGITREDLGMEVSHAKTIMLRVEVEYQVSGFKEQANGEPNRQHCDR